MCHNCFMLNNQQDRIMDKIIEEKLGIVSVRQRFPSDKVWLVAYEKGIKLYEGFEV